MTGRRWVVRLLVGLYPAAWRREFGEEFADLLERSPLGGRVVGDVVLGAARAWMVGRHGMSELRFEARYDGLARVLSVLVVVVLLVIPLLLVESGLGMAIVGVCSLLVLGISYAYSPRGYAISGGALRVKRLAGDVVIPLDRLRFVRDATTADFWGCIRLWGSSGLFGYYGWCWSSGLGMSRWYVTDRSRALLVTDGAGMIYVSPVDRDRFVGAIPVAGAVGSLPPADDGRFVTVGSLLGIGIGVVVIGSVVAAVRYDPGRPPVDLRRDGLEIHSRFYGMTVAAAQVDVGGVRVVDLDSEKEWRPTLRVGGFGNSYYRAGNFRVANGRTVKLFTTGARRLVMLPPLAGDGKPVLLDVEEPEQFAARVRTVWGAR